MWLACHRASWEPREPMRSLGMGVGVGGCRSYGVCVVTSLSPRWGWFSFQFLPTACAVGCILTPLRGWSVLADFASCPTDSADRWLLVPITWPNVHWRVPASLLDPSLLAGFLPGAESFCRRLNRRRTTSITVVASASFAAVLSVV